MGGMKGSKALMIDFHIIRVELSDKLFRFGEAVCTVACHRNLKSCNWKEIVKTRLHLIILPQCPTLGPYVHPQFMPQFMPQFVKTTRKSGVLPVFPGYHPYTPYNAVMSV